MKRILNLDLIRVIALLLIVSNHALNTVFDATNYIAWLEYTNSSKIFILVGYVLCRIGVPLFLMLSGCLILNKKFENGKDIKKFYRSNLIPLVITVIIWNIIYYFFYLFYYDVDFSIKEFLYVILFMKVSKMPHMWYMPMIIGLYIVLPFLANIVKKYKFKDLFLPITLSFVAFYLLPNARTFLTFLGFEGTNIRTIIDVSALGGTYLLYIVMGYYIFNEKILSKVKSRYLCLAFLVCLIGTCLFQVLGYTNGSNYIIYYNFAGILFTSIMLFELLIRIKIKEKNYPLKVHKLVTYLSMISLGIYFIHRPVLFIFKKYWILDFNPCLNVIIYYVCSILISIIFILILERFKIFRKYLLLIKGGKSEKI